MQSTLAVGSVKAIAIKTAVGGPMRLVSDAAAERDGGLVGGVRHRPERGITLLATRAWQRATADLGVELPWDTRRANILVETDALGHLIGKTIQCGEVVVEVLGETRPCGQMDDAHQGLCAALKPDCRAGVHGRVLAGGSIAVGDMVTIVPTVAG
ncbi:MAG: MOSC domain-containing protein [Planctomycetes bacterium]|nr:MOSC domain-containing protein [Planctomycetota bacterium]